MTCVNCGRKGHAASECREGKNKKAERPCFTCGKPGHEARHCPNRDAVPRRGADVKAIENGPARTVAVFCATKKEVDPDGFTTVAKGPKPQQPHLGDFVRSSVGRSTSQGSTNRFRLLSLSDWQDIAADVRGESHKGEVVEVVPPATPVPNSFLDVPNLLNL